MFTNLVLEIVARTATPTPDSAEVWSPINNLKDLLLTGCASVGVIVIIIAIITFLTSLVSHDNAQKISSIWVFVVGAGLIGAYALLNAIVK